MPLLIVDIGVHVGIVKIVVRRNILLIIVQKVAVIAVIHRPGFAGSRMGDLGLFMDTVDLHILAIIYHVIPASPAVHATIHG